ncbi:Release factor glutamine methyltransferase [Corynebacterium guangdongense]|uniref:Methylase of polypeptide subunit release factors n=2 Tax=Corynebacterium guangdongense TaxID=1783348 RepID=A0ABU1ZX35_9CORY|nr:class I SAM-dependent methyltransferase [Corynebacterium guangdongense]MDR7329497.1 methylase of polypeptide subunit release factors [Corynebacterium guangdongense]WJZ18062.1 Release factor glutamine methyltransferase [Corynebacterium guangdongense]
MNDLNITEAARAIGVAFRRAGLTTSGLASALGPGPLAALHRGEPGAVRWALGARTDGQAGLIRAFILRDPIAPAELDRLVGTPVVEQLTDVLATEGERVRLLIDVRPHVIDGVERLVVSDADASMTAHVPGPEHVLGVGAASLSLLGSTPTSPVDSVLDLGTGSGIQLLGQTRAAASLTAIDVHPRAIALAEATLAANELDGVELLTGSWFEPVSGRRFDRIVSNPPFVVGLPEVGHVYRDSGLNLDGASELVVSSAPGYLVEGGTAHLLAAWIHPTDGSWRQRLASWIPERGVDAWILQRDLADPQLYVGTWLKDESLDPRSLESAARAEAWLNHFAEHDVAGIGFGFVALRNIGDRPSEVVIEEIPQHFDDPLGPEVEEYFARTAWLRDADRGHIADTRFRLRPGVAREEIAVTDEETGMGFAPAALRLTRTDGPRFTHEVDEALAAIVAGLHPDGLPLAEVVGIYAAACGLDDDRAEELLEQAVGAAVDLVRHGFLIPAELMED